MTPEEEKELYGGLTEDPDGASEETYSLEEILAEYGSSREQRLWQDVEAAAARETSPAAADPLQKGKEEPAAEVLPEPEAPPETEKTISEAENPPEKEEPLPEADSVPEEPAFPEKGNPEPVPEDLKDALPPPPRPIPMEEVVSQTVDAVMEEQHQHAPRRPRRWLFSRRKMQDTEELYPEPEEEEPEEEEQEILEDEEDAADAAERYHREWRGRKRGTFPALCITLVLLALLGAERGGLSIPVWSGDAKLQSLVLLGCGAVVCLLGRQVFRKAVSMLLHKRCTSELLACGAMLACEADCLVRLFSPARSDAMPYMAAACAAMVFAMWGGARESRGMYDTFRAAAMDEEPPYLVTDTEKGACKQRGSIPGFYSAAVKDPLPVIWQTALLPVVLTATLVFAGLGSLGQHRGADFFLNWSALLTAGATCAMPLCWGLPWSRLARKLQKEGCALAGWRGAEKISRRRAMILSDTDLFPPGTISLNGVKLIGEELPRAVSYAASLCRAADSGLLRLFGGLLRSEGGSYREVEDFSFYEEGGYSGTIRGESVLLGTASFMRKMDVRLPGNLNLKTGIFLSVDRQLAAVFAVKYNPAENVDWALRTMRHSRITPILAARDPNITPALLKRKFNKKVHVEYPDLTTRVALSEAEQDRGLPRALLLREGLLPYAETVVGGRRLCRAVRQTAALSLLGSVAGTLLTFYLTFLGAYSLVSPLSLMIFLLLWTLPVLLVSDTVARF